MAILIAGRKMPEMSDSAGVRDVGGAIKGAEGGVISAGATARRRKFHCLLMACARLGNVEAAEHCMQQILELGQANRASYRDTIIACVKAGQLERAEAWIINMTQAGIAAPKAFSRPLVRAWTEGHQMRGVEIAAEELDKLAKWLLQINKVGVELNRSTINHMMAAYARAGNVSETERWRYLMGQTGILPNRSTFQALVTACMVASDHVCAEHWLGQMEEFGYEPGLLTMQQGRSSSKSEQELHDGNRLASTASAIGSHDRACQHARTLGSLVGLLSTFGLPKAPQHELPGPR